jgi:hypothetical protein
MTFTRFKTFALIAGLAAPTLVGAQDAQRPIELGIDAAVVRQSGDNRTTTFFQLPVGRFRVGFHMSDAISLEPSIALSYGRTTFENPATGQDITSSGTAYELDFGLLYHIRTDRSKAQPYVRPFVGIHGSNSESDGGFDASTNQFALGAALGFKVPATNRLGTRFEIGFSHETEDDSDDGGAPSSNSIFFAIGLSFFTR